MVPLRTSIHPAIEHFKSFHIPRTWELFCEFIFSSEQNLLLISRLIRVSGIIAALENTMKKVSVATYKKDTLYPKVVRAMARILKTSDEISPVTILLQMGNLEPKAHEAWRRGQVRYLERVFQGSLSKANRILRIIGFHAHELKMVPSQHTYRQTGKNNVLRFSKTEDPNIEKSYARHFSWNQSKEKKELHIEKTLSE